MKGWLDSGEGEGVSFGNGRLLSVGWPLPTFFPSLFLRFLDNGRREKEEKPREV